MHSQYTPGDEKDTMCYKIRYNTRREARLHADALNRKSRIKTVSPYRCRHCGFWHVGNVKPSRKYF